MIRRKYKFKDFVTAMAFLQKVGDLAEARHYPDLHLTGYKNVAIELSTPAPSAGCRQTTSSSPRRSTSCTSDTQPRGNPCLDVRQLRSGFVDKGFDLRGSR